MRIYLGMGCLQQPFDDRLLKRAREIRVGPPKVVSPLELIAEIGP